MKKSTERKRIDRMGKDNRRLFMNGIITVAQFERIVAILKTADKKL